MSGTEMDMVGVSTFQKTHMNLFLTYLLNPI